MPVQRVCNLDGDGMKTWILYRCDVEKSRSILEVSISALAWRGWETTYNLPVIFGIRAQCLPNAILGRCLYTNLNCTNTRKFSTLFNFVGYCDGSICMSYCDIVGRWVPWLRQTLTGSQVPSPKLWLGIEPEPWAPVKTGEPSHLGRYRSDPGASSQLTFYWAINCYASPSGHSGSDLGLTSTDIFRSLQHSLQATAALPYE